MSLNFIDKIDIKKICMVIVCVFIIITLINFDRVFVAPISNQILYTIDINPGFDAIPVGEMVEGMQIRQTFFYEGWMSKFSVQFATYARYNYGKMNVSLYINNNRIYESIVEYQEIEDNVFRSFLLHYPIYVSNDYELQLLITALEGDSGSSITTWISINDDYVKGDLYVDDILHTESNLLFRVGYSNAFIRPVFWGFALLWLFVIMVIMYLLAYRKVVLENIFIIVALVIGITYLFLIPPPQTPDEITHIISSYYYSSRLLGFPNDAVSEADIYLFRGPRLGNGLCSYKILYETLFGTADRSTSIYMNFRPHNEPFYLYLFSAIGMATARSLNFNLETLIISGSLMNLIFYTFVTYLAIKLMPFGKMVLFCVALFPMSIQQAASNSPDSILNALTFLLIAYSCYLAVNINKITIRNYILLTILLAIIAPIKGGIYLPFVLMCLLVPVEIIKMPYKCIDDLLKNKKIRKDIFVYFCTFVVISIPFAILTLNRIFFVATEAHPGHAQRATYTVSFIIQNPIDFLFIFINTLHKLSDFYILSAVGSRLGSLNIPIQGSLIFGFIFVAFLSALSVEESIMDGKNLFIKNKNWIVIALLCVSVFTLTLLAMFIAWTAYGSSFIDGAQGRYFTPVIPLLFLLLAKAPIAIKRNINSILIVSIMVLQFFTVINVLEVFAFS